MRLRVQRTYTDTRARQTTGISFGFDIHAAHRWILRQLHRFIVLFGQSVDQNDNAGLMAGVVVATSSAIT
ncbi:hypothetical protein M3O57_06840 [Xanthomonas nasturtii]|uniref:Transposase n=1 Tax=Xanthomonas nasturtii TaxID=1843581 RepID=A0ABT0LN88_9XANT|nr:hypothetical protein [Xanthomonas nasturtii]MCL1499127.1 hypothetical protein [Xanthomonas nasturtii]MCL1502414.1 hypothetical protein [Xanthomonas nasturtii]MCL1522139.1 hypothetical protein [Xanthomonas nasturtii]MCL1525089.1 hypothetical protein [Xanthomonas nasturtii]MCL1529906.1 hypothetical protein [Xanthomonas nasturtii]